MNTQLKVLIDFEKIKDPFSGLGQYCAHLKNYFDQSPLKPQYWIPSKFHRLAKKCSRLMPYSDVFHATHQDSPYLPYSSKTKYLLTIHDLNALSEIQSEKSQKKFITQLQNKIDRASAVTFISKYTQQEVEARFELNGKKSLVIYNGISLPASCKQPPRVPTSKFLFAIGTVLPKKNFHVLIEFLKLLPSEFQIVLAGTTFHEYAKSMMEKIQAEGLQDRFFLVGTISEEEKRWYYEHAEAFLFPSLLEGFGLPVAEAMSLGLPLFLSDKTSLPEIGGPDAYYFKNFEPSSMLDVFLNGMKDFSTEKKIRLLERSQLFNWQKAAESYLNLYESL
jgi:glycosyltransferase involved in cell wall biosynthesis